MPTIIQRGIVATPNQNGAILAPASHHLSILALQRTIELGDVLDDLLCRPVVLARLVAERPEFGVVYDLVPLKLGAGILHQGVRRVVQLSGLSRYLLEVLPDRHQVVDGCQRLTIATLRPA